MAFTLATMVRETLGMNNECTFNPATGVVGPRTSGYITHNYTTQDSTTLVLAANYFAPYAYTLCPGDSIKVNQVDVNGVTVCSYTLTVKAVTVAIINTPPNVNVAAAVTVATIGAITKITTISTAELLAAAFWPITDTPPANNYVQLLGLSAALHWNSVAYAGAATISAKYGTGGVVASGVIANTFLAATANFIAAPLPAALTAAAATSFVGIPLVLEASGASTAGNSPVRVTTVYQLAQLS